MLLTVQDLTGERGGETVFSDVTFVLSKGQSAIVTGPNGSGKSTLLRILAGLLPAAAGEIRLRLGGEERQTTSCAHYLGHQNAMKPALTVAENLAFWRAFLGEARMSVAGALAHIGLESIADLPFGYLSAGQRRRVAIARLLVSHRPLWLLDEPTSSLDAASERQFAALLRSHLEEGGIVVATTHVPLELAGAVEVRMGAV